MANQRWTKCRGFDDTQRQAIELISGPSLGTKAKFLTFNRTQPMVVTRILAGHNALRRHLHLLGLLERVSEVWGEKGNLGHILYKCEALALLRNAYLGSFSLEPEDIKSLSLWAIWNFSKVTELP